MSADLLRTAKVYALGVGPLSTYSYIACPVMNDYGKATIVGTVLAGFAVALVLEALHRRAYPDVDPVRRWSLKFLLWLTPVLAMALTEVYFGDELEHIALSTAILSAGALTFGFIGSSWNSIQEERHWIERLAAEGRNTPPGRFLSMARRVRNFGIGSYVTTAIVVAIVLRDDVPMSYPPHQVFLVLIPIVGVAVVAVAREYEALFRQLYQLERKVLGQVAEGQFDVSVPLLSQDEFRAIAEGTNAMIAGLRERERARQTFGKFFSPETSRRILERGAKLGGERMEVTILFTDLRNYTALSEALSPEQVVSVLNEYFTMVVAAVRRNGGELDKFIGDAAMAVFGLDGAKEPCAAAVRTAFEIREGLETLRAKLRERGFPEIENGIGIHHGPVIAGNIGSEDRLEHTVIGDAVNIASRLESLTKSLGKPIAVSDEVLARLDPALRARLADAGEHAVKGKSLPLRVHAA